MKKLFVLLCTLFLSYLSIGYAEIFSPLSCPTPFIHGVNLISGRVEEDIKNMPIAYEMYVEGWNKQVDHTFYLSPGDSRIGKVKAIHFKEPSLSAIQLFYENGSTCVQDSPERSSVYRYNQKGLIQTVEHYQKEAASHFFNLYRCERVFWENSATPRFTSRILEEANGQVVVAYHFAYNEQGQLVKETISGNLSGECQVPLILTEAGYPVDNGIESYSKTYTYTEKDDGLLIQEVEDNGLSTAYQFGYEDQEQLIAAAGSRGEVTEEESIIPKERYNAQGLCISTLDEYDNEITYAYDAFGRLISTQLPLVLDAWDQPYHPLIKQEYNICDQIVEIVNAQGEKTSFSYNVRGKPTKISYPDGTHERMVYFLDGVLKEKIARDGTKMTFTRDEEARLVKLEKRSVTGQLIQQFSFDYQGERVQSMTDHQQMTIRYLYDDEDRQIGILQETADGTRHLEWTYDDDGQKNQVREWFGSAPEDFITKIEERDQGHQTKVIHFENAQGEVQSRQAKKQDAASFHFIVKQESKTLNGLGQYVKQVEQIDGYGMRHVFIYDALQRLESSWIYDAMGTKLGETHRRYDALDRKVLEKHQVLAAGQSLRPFTMRWNYDAAGRLLAIMEEGDQTQTKTTRYSYHPSGELKEMIKPDGTCISYSYNDLGLLEYVEASDGSVAYAYVYDDLQRLIAIHDHCHQLVQTRRYNAFNEVIEEEQRPGIKLKYHYDLAGRRLKLILPDHSQVAYHYQGPLLAALERLDKDQNSLYTHIYQYDAEGRLEAEQLLNDLGTIHYRYNQGKLLKIQSPWWSQTIEEGGRGLDGRLVFMTIEDAQGRQDSHFTYTADGQLATEEGYDYTYDSLFNRLSENGQNWHVNDLNQLKETPHAKYIYDQNGNLIEKQQADYSIFYTYDAFNRLTRVEHPKEKAMSYVYDAFHRRLADCEWEWNDRQNTWNLKNQTYLLYDDSKEIGKLNAQGEIFELRVLGVGRGAEISAAVAIELQDRIFVPLHDLGGSVRCLIDAQKKSVAETYRYTAYGQEKIWDAWGNSQAHSLVGNPWRFCSKRVDEESGLVFFGRRYYDPLCGRWITPDPLFFYDAPNLYAFTRNDPLNCYDLYGLFSISEIWDYFSQSFYASFNNLRISAHNLKSKLNAELKFPDEWGESLEKAGKQLFGESTYLLMGHSFEDTYVGTYGKHNVHDKVRVTFINGILTTHSMIRRNLEIISQSHGEEKIHYIFRPTEGWTWDISKSLMIKLAFNLGFRSLHACLLAQMWRDLITEMGGVEGGGIIIHYAHSLGGSETDRARELLSPEEQRMIRVHTFGSATLIRNRGFESVVNHVSLKDGVVMNPIIEPLGLIRNYFDPESNVRTYGFWGSPSYWPVDHILSGPTYGPIVYELGEQFLAEFASQKE